MSVAIQQNNGPGLGTLLALGNKIEDEGGDGRAADTAGGDRKLKEVDARVTLLEAQLTARVLYKPQLWPTPQP